MKPKKFLKLNSKSREPQVRVIFSHHWIPEDTEILAVMVPQSNLPELMRRLGKVMQEPEVTYGILPIEGYFVKVTESTRNNQPKAKGFRA